MLAGIYDLNIEQGASWTFDMTWKDDQGDPVDLTGYSARMKVRKSYQSSVVLALTTADGDITLGGVLGTIEIAASATTTSEIPIDYNSLSINSGKQCQVMVYDLELESGSGTVTRLLQGSAYVYPEATR